MKKAFTFFVCLSIITHVNGQEKKSPELDGYYQSLRNSFNAQNAYETVAFVEKRWRLAGNSGFNESIRYVEEILKQAGYKKEEKGESDGMLTYRIETRKMNRPTWEPVSASLRLGNDAEAMLDFSTNRNMIAMYSSVTPSEGVTGEIVYVGAGNKKDFEGKNVKGKIVFGEGGVRSLYKNAIENGASGVLAYSMPDYNQPSVHINSIQFQGIPFDNPADQKWGILLSYAAKEKIKSALGKGKITATVKINCRIYPSDELTIVANVKGAVKPDERFVFSAHVQEPGANDNATGVGTLAEMARVTAELVQQKKLKPARTLTFLWGDEIVSTRRYITEDANRAKGIKWGLSLDMVGEDVSKTGGSFLIEKMPDPSAIWTRGKEKHSEWGGEVLKESQLFPHYFNDLLLNRCLQQSQENGWVVKTNPFEGGSDHTPFLDANIPGLLMWHFTDVFYHTDGDRLDMVSPAEMRNVGISALATAYVLLSADEKMALLLIWEVKNNALERLETEFLLSREAVKKGGDLKQEQHILDVWSSYYETGIDKMIEISVGGTSDIIRREIESSKVIIRDKTRGYGVALKNE
jgi:aminopeptidase YwaD